MARQARQLSSTGVYHIMLRGINQQSILEEEKDNIKFIEILKDCMIISGYKLYAYCLMGNHVHLLMKVEEEPLAQIFKRICGRYVYWYNAKYQRVGHLLQGRFKSEPVEDEGSLLRVLRYIHQNPVKAGLVKNAKDYPFSSYHCYMKPRDNQLVDTDFVLNMMNSKHFEEYHNEYTEDNLLHTIERRFTLTDEQAKGIIRIVSKCSTAPEFQQLEAKVRNSYIRRFRQEGLSIRQINRLTGVSKGIIERC